MVLLRDNGSLRQSTLLPSVKCSSCGLQVEISLMGDHFCPGPTAELSPPPDNDGTFGHPPLKRPPEKHGRLPAPVDTGAANRAFMYQGQLTPVSLGSGSRNISPMTPGIGTGAQQRDGAFPCETGNVDTAARTSPYLQQAGEPFGGGQCSSKTAKPPISCKPIGEALMERMNGMAHGPFDTSRRPLTAGGNEPMPLNRPKSPAHEPLKDQNWCSMNHPMPSPGVNGSLSAPKPPARSDYEGFGPPPTPRSAEPNTAFPDRPEAFAKPELPDFLRRPSMPSPHATLLPPMNIPSNRRPSLSPDTSRRPPPRTSLIPHDVDASSVDLAAEFGSSNPYHAPSESSSSCFSTFSAQSHASSHTSFTRSDFGEDAVEDGTRDKTGPHGLPTEQLRPVDLRLDVNAPMRHPSMLPPAYAVSPRAGSATRPGPGPEGYRPYTRPLPSPQLDAPAPSPLPHERSKTPPQRKPSPDPSSLPSRGDCRGCRQAITGKSVSSADGRLTGKYHKACFVCTTCSAPFASAEFYVLDDRPYCEQHYHRLNGSLCGGCGRGIEGQYVEDESRIKHHVDCFCCLDCGSPLSGGYFEVDGKAYCERDALRRTQSSPQPFPLSPGAHTPHGQRPYSPGPRPYGAQHPGRPMAPPRTNYGGPTAGPPSMPRSPYGGASPGRLGASTSPRSRPTMNKRMTRIGMM